MVNFVKKHLERAPLHVTHDLGLNRHDHFLLFKVDKTDSFEKDPGVLENGSKS